MVLLDIVDIRGFPKCFFCNIFWSVLERIYYENTMSNENEKKMFHTLKKSLLEHNTWGVFLHYLKFHANVYDEKKDFIIYISDLDDEEKTILNTQNFFETCRRPFLDEYIIEQFILNLFPNIILFHQNNNDENGRLTMLVNGNVDDTVKNFLNRFGFNGHGILVTKSPLNVL